MTELGLMKHSDRKYTHLFHPIKSTTQKSPAACLARAYVLHIFA